MASSGVSAIGLTNATPSRVLSQARWGFTHKVGFRFAFAYFCLYLYPGSSTLGWFWWFWVDWEYESPWRKIVPWVGANILRIHTPVIAGTGEDSTYGYVKIFCFVAIAALAAAIWTLVDRKGVANPKLDQWLRLYLRFVVASTMIGFGAMKVIPVQMDPPSLTSMMVPVGDLGPSPYSFLWTFMGASPGYQIFCGLVEVAGGILLLIPGMTTLGALLSLGAAVNVFAMNGFYGVPLKMPVGHLILITAFLLLPDASRLLNILVLNRATEPEHRPPLVQRRWLNYSLWGLLWALGAYAFVIQSAWAIGYTRRLHAVSTTNPLYGIWNVSEFTADGTVRPPLLTDNERWQRVIFDSDVRLSQIVATIQEMNGQFSSYVVTLDPQTGSLSLKSPQNKRAESEFQMATHRRVGKPGNAQLNYKRLAPDAMILEGTMNGRLIRVALNKEDRHFAIQKLGFRWVVEDQDTRLDSAED